MIHKSKEKRSERVHLCCKAACSGKRKKVVCERKVGIPILHLTHIGEEKEEKKGFWVNFLCKHPKSLKWIVEDKQRVTLGIQSFCHHQNTIRGFYKIYKIQTIKIHPPYQKINDQGWKQNQLAFHFWGHLKVFFVCLMLSGVKFWTPKCCSCKWNDKYLVNLGKAHFCVCF